MTALPRRRALLGMVGLLAAPAIIRTPGLLMPVRKVELAPDFDFHLDAAADGLTRREWRIGAFRSVDAGDRDYTVWAVVKADGALDVRFSLT